MAAWAPNDVRREAAELAALADSVFNDWIPIAELEIDSRVFGARYPRVGALLTAHLMVMGGAGVAVGVPIPGKGGGLGAVTGITVGSVSAQFASLAAQPGMGGAHAAALSLTRWGLEFMRQVSISATGPWLAGVDD